MPLSLNHRFGPHAHAKRVKEIRATAEALARAEGIPAMDHCSLYMVWTVPDLRKRDVENPIGTFKPFADGLVDAGIVPDDSPRFMTKWMPEIRTVKGRRCIEFIITDENPWSET
jgi:crossover junction endodeoxyribonuclease RusA